jgi:hypothetical protein
MNQNKKSVIFVVLLWSIIIGFIVTGLIIITKQDRELEKSPIYSYAVIVDKYVGAKAKDYVRFEFEVNGRIIDGHQAYMPHKQHVNIGDSCEIVYAGTNPEINRILKDENRLLKLVRKKKFLRYPIELPYIDE